MNTQLSKYGIYGKNDFFDQAFSRNIGLLTVEEQNRLRNARVAIPGMGGVGGIHLITMARTGIGKATISDFDHFEPANTNRQYGANTSNYGRSKLDVMKEQAQLINPFMEVNTIAGGINENNIDEFLLDVDVVLDGLDFFNFEIRRLLFNRAREKGVHVITAGPMGYSSALLIFSPDKGMAFDDYFNVSDQLSFEEKILSFALGLAPRATHIKYMDFSKVDLSDKAGPSLAASCQICAGMAGTEALRIILKKKGLRPVPHYVQFDPFLMKLRKGKLWFGNKNPVQRIKIFYVKNMLDARKGIAKTLEPNRPIGRLFNNKEMHTDLSSYLLNAAIQAPSGDNAQPWKFKIDANTISVLVDDKADTSFFNVNQAASKISCGAAVENIKIAAAGLGLNSDTQCVIKNEEIGAKISLTDKKKASNILAESIWKRHTNRTFYKKDAMPGHVIENCKNSISSIPGSRLYTLTIPKEIIKLAKIVSKADRIRTENRSLHEHFISMLRFKQEEIYSTNDGLPLKNLKVGLAGEYFLRFSKPWSTMDFINKIGIGRLVAMHSYKGIVKSSAVMLLTMDGTSDERLIQGGRALQRIWLELTRLGYDVQPMTAITLFFLRFNFGLENEFSSRHLNMLEKLHTHFFKLFPEIDDNDGLIMLFRVGRGREIRHFTKRKPVSAFME